VGAPASATFATTTAGAPPSSEVDEAEGATDDGAIDGDATGATTAGARSHAITVRSTTSRSGDTHTY
jgi:hypothetical protein